MTELLLSATVIMFASLSGIVFLWVTAKDFLEKNIHYLSSFSAGVFLIVALNLTNEAVSHPGHSLEGLGWIAVGVLLLLGMFKVLPYFHHHHSKDQGDHHHDNRDAHRILFSDAIHNLGDGVLLVSTFSVSTELGFITTFGIFIHEFIQEISEFFVLKDAGYSTKKALSLNFVISSTILIGAVGAYYATNIFSSLELPLIGIAAGSFLVVVFNDLIPKSLHYSQHSKKHAQHVAAFLIGVFLILSINNLTAETHIHGELDEHAHEEHSIDEHADDNHRH